MQICDYKCGESVNMSSVKLISFTQPSKQFIEEMMEGEEYDSIQDLIAFCARVSNPSNQTNFLSSDKLISYLIKHKHWSPFEMVNVCMEIETTRDIARQILRHRSFSFQEFSQRYAVSEGFIQTSQVRLQDEKNRQNSL